MPKKGRARRRQKARRHAQKAKERAQKADKTCALCHETDKHLRRFKVAVDGKTAVDWRCCRYCTATLEVLLRDPRNRR